MNTKIDLLNEQIINCHLCPRLVSWREEIAKEKRRQFADQNYWGKPIPYFGDHDATLLIVGLAPAAHGANRTGRMFTGDRSGDFLFAALHRARLASQPTSVVMNDGLELDGVLIAACAHCAPPDNKPLPSELANCSRYLSEILEMPQFRAILCLGGLAWNQVHRLRGGRTPKFGHGALSTLGAQKLVASFHPSQQNTFTGRLTPEMLDNAIATWSN